MSHDYNHTHESSTFDATFTKVIEGKSNFVKVGSLVRQRVGLLLPYDRHGPRDGARQVIRRQKIF